ncbi:hypothetical protein Btru_071950 [Bulinus truncatus]|nr:hypothetical protein Btru_071950 [Bulinus truncatus]
MYGMWGWWCVGAVRLVVLLSSISFGMSITSLILLTLVVVDREKDKLSTEVPDNANRQTLCVPYWLVSSDQLRHQLKNRSQWTEDSLCFECSSDKLSHFLTSMLNLGQNRTETVIRPDKLSTPVSTHLQLTPSIEIKQLSENRVVPEINQHFVLGFGNELNPSVEHMRGSQITREGLLVFYSGIYFIYSSIQFKKTTDASSSQTLFQYVKRESPNNPQYSGVLMRSVYTPCQDCEHFEETSFIGGVFHLQYGDYVRVCVSSEDVVNFETPSTYAGLVMLNSNR